MGLFGNKRSSIGYGKVDPSKLAVAPPVYLDGYEPTLDDASENMKDQAIEYIVSLNKADKDKFFESVELIWQGYQIMEKVETRHQKALQRNAKASDGSNAIEDEDELLGSFLDDVDDDTTAKGGSKNAGK